MSKNGPPPSDSTRLALATSNAVKFVTPHNVHHPPPEKMNLKNQAILLAKFFPSPPIAISSEVTVAGIVMMMDDVATQVLIAQMLEEDLCAVFPHWQGASSQGQQPANSSLDDMLSMVLSSLCVSSEDSRIFDANTRISANGMTRPLDTRSTPVLVSGSLPLPAPCLPQPMWQQIPPPVDAHAVRLYPDLTWMDNAIVLQSNEPFTMEMIHTHRCGYCSAFLTSQRDLQYHLGGVRRHNVFACCGRFFPSRIEFDAHSPFGFDHVHRYRNDVLE